MPRSKVMESQNEKESDSGTETESDSEDGSSYSSSESESSGSESQQTTDDNENSQEEDKPSETITKKNEVPSNEVVKSARKRKRKPRPITICLINCRYEVVRKVTKRHGLQEVNDDEAWNIYWTDFSVSLERAMDMRRYQMVNHFPGMNEICRKDLLARNLNRMRKLFPKEYDIYPKTWCLPSDLGDLQNYTHLRRNKTFICKPEMGCQGRGIFLIRNIKDLNPFGKIICQQYISKPFLIDDFKFDFRIYVLITSCDPLRVYVYKEGLARFATAKYRAPTNTNTENSYMHLTNYAVNKFSRDYIVDDEAGSKRKLTSVYRWFEQRGYDKNGILDSIDDVIMKTIISAHGILRHNYKTCFPNHDIGSACFEILGFDILIDHKLKPYVLEVNHSPSFHTDAKLDLEIKEGLLNDAVSMLNFKRLDKYKVEVAERKRVQERLQQKLGRETSTKVRKEEDKSGGSDGGDEAQFNFELEHSGGYRLIYPTENYKKYDVFFEQNSSSVYQETAASQARAILTKTQLLEYNTKRQEEETKRVGGTPKEVPQNKESKMRPESPTSGTKTTKTAPKKDTRSFLNSFKPMRIEQSEELDRMRGIMQRGMIVRSLGIEALVFELLCQNGTIKPKEEKIFRRIHGQTGNNMANLMAKTQSPRTAQTQRSASAAGGDASGDELWKMMKNKKNESGGGIIDVENWIDNGEKNKEIFQPYTVPTVFGTSATTPHQPQLYMSEHPASFSSFSKMRKNLTTPNPNTTGSFGDEEESRKIRTAIVEEGSAKTEYSIPRNRMHNTNRPMFSNSYDPHALSGQQTQWHIMRSNGAVKHSSEDGSKSENNPINSTVGTKSVLNQMAKGNWVPSVLTTKSISNPSKNYNNYSRPVTITQMFDRDFFNKKTTETEKNSGKNRLFDTFTPVGGH